MAGEIRLQATTGLTIKALIIAENGTVWNGSALVATSTLSDANWTASLVACVEEQTSDTTGAGLYLANWPGALTQDAIYSVQFFTGASPSPGDLVHGVQQDPTEKVEADTATILADTDELQGDWANAGRLDVILDAIPTTAMRGTDGANTTVPDAAGTAPTAVEIQAEMEANGASILDTLRDDLADGGRLDLIFDIIAADVVNLDGAAMRGTDSAALASIWTTERAGALTDWIDGGRLDVILDAIVSDTGTGARTITVTVNDGTGVLENANVRYTEGGNTYLGSTNASGLVTFSLDDATYGVAVAKPGHSFTPTTLVVDGDKTPTYSMTVVTVTAPPNASTTTGVMTVYDEQGSVESGVTVTVQILDGPGTDGIGYDSTEWAETSSALGVVEFAGIILGARYKIWRGTSKPSAETFTAPTTGDSFDLTEVIGRG